MYFAIFTHSLAVICITYPTVAVAASKISHDPAGCKFSDNGAWLYDDKLHSNISFEAFNFYPKQSSANWIYTSCSVYFSHGPTRHINWSQSQHSCVLSIEEQRKIVPISMFRQLIIKPRNNVVSLVCSNRSIESKKRNGLHMFSQQILLDDIQHAFMLAEYQRTVMCHEWRQAGRLWNYNREKSTLSNSRFNKQKKTMKLRRLIMLCWRFVIKKFFQTQHRHTYTVDKNIFSLSLSLIYNRSKII